MRAENSELFVEERLTSALNVPRNPGIVLSVDDCGRNA